MSRLTDLLAQARKTDPQLAADLEAEFRQLTRRSQFGLVFERHQPEAVELPGRPVRRGDTVRVLPPRGSLTIGDTRHWVVTDLERTPDGKQAHLTEADVDPEVREPATSTAALEDLVVVARFEDPIYPGLVETGRVERGGDKPFHTVINAENFHALEMLTYTHRHKVDCIYIDPPYNTGAKDWKYNNDYVEADDDYRHSKWLSFMERRLQVARELLNPEDSVLIVTIDEKEYLRLGLLLEQTFPEARRKMISSVINPKGVGVTEGFKRVDEYIYILRLGTQSVVPSKRPPLGSLPLDVEPPKQTQDEQGSQRIGLDWQTARRRDLASVRHTRPGQFYPIYVNEQTGRIEDVGEAIPHGMSRFDAPTRPGCVSVFPVRDDGTEMNWGVTAPTFIQRWKSGYARAGKAQPDKPQTFIIQYLKSGTIKDIEQGRVTVEGRNEDGSLVAFYDDLSAKAPPTQWNLRSHNAEHYGTKVTKSLLPGRSFPFPKSLYAVEDVLRLFVREKPNALILDFFSGSGTTAHAVMRLNKQDGGRRQCISVTNNEVSAEEQRGLRAKGLRPGDPEWEQWGICDYITKPRITAAITGETPAGDPVKGAYKFTDEFPMADGFEENAAFFTLTYEAPRQVRRNRAFARVAPMLWFKAGSRGRIISSLPERGWDVAQAYGVLEDIDHAPEFLAALEADPQVGMAFIVTDSEVAFQSVARQLPEHTTAVRLYESYLHNFQINRRA
ncbi:DNA methyltransferase (plasmid) [Micrococcus luteus]|uniref:site-specific DNA-methyltransferase n=1 Tax=Micrococcus luteus TaxID=1270 RepID=UPI003C2F8504